MARPLGEDIPGRWRDETARVRLDPFVARFAGATGAEGSNPGLRRPLSRSCRLREKAAACHCADNVRPQYVPYQGAVTDSK